MTVNIEVKLPIYPSLWLWDGASQFNYKKCGVLINKSRRLWCLNHEELELNQENEVISAMKSAT